jgi:hypothetical protein
MHRVFPTKCTSSIEVFHTKQDNNSLQNAKATPFSDSLFERALDTSFPLSSAKMQPLIYIFLISHSSDERMFARTWDSPKMKLISWSHMYAMVESQKRWANIPWSAKRWFVVPSNRSHGCCHCQHHKSKFNGAMTLQGWPNKYSTNGCKSSPLSVYHGKNTLMTLASLRNGFHQATVPWAICSSCSHQQQQLQ